MNALQAVILSAALAAVAPLFSHQDQQESVVDSQVQWPSEFRGRSLVQLPLTEREQTFLSGFPGSTARFTDGESEIVIRHVLSPTRKLHPAEDCYRANSYRISESRIVRDGDSEQWHCFKVHRADSTREVCEQLQDSRGGRWTDVSSWYWAATLGKSPPPWTVITVAR